MTRTFKPVRVKCAWTLMFIAACLVVAQDSVLHIKVVTGDGAQHSPGAHAKPLTVEVTDATGRPVAGARVSFQVPGEGPGGVFANGLRTEIAITDSSGHATAHGLQLNRTEGTFAIRITAAKEQARAGTIARQSIGNADAQIESADRKAPTPAATQPPTRSSGGAAASHPAPTGHLRAGHYGHGPRESRSGPANAAARAERQNGRRAAAGRAHDYRDAEKFEIDFGNRRRWRPQVA